jgi:DNA-binding IclR family transcriptional regulator
MPLHSTGVGLVLLAHAPAQVQEEILGGDLADDPETTHLSGRELRARLAAVRRNGVAVASRSLPEPMTSVASPIVDQHSAPIAALSVITRSEHIEPAVLTPAVIAVARAISRAVSTGTHPDRTGGIRMGR